MDKKEEAKWKLSVEDFEKTACYRDHGDYNPIGEL